MQWLNLLKQAVDGANITQVAERMDVSRTTISLVMSGKYPAKTDNIAARVMDIYGRVDCPFLGVQIVQAECREHCSSAVPTSSPRAMKHWRACQSCQIGKNLNQEETCKPQ
ncbi:hypothetical protein SKTS_13380 [Sulfurimicrobium lacus]|uniref:Uncharacterized protein n=1 Tax=Sulfurimicrobium lacus TaxID=2715678 RepID=A0A6F8VBV8_9PROT|nr:helix-turn-helix transcriptional regulator [Sulfurimicrobium lacus]BCB26452.1 hypothetical protein SKTS_13380 [Sulfurimicrobium lacus]